MIAAHRPRRVAMLTCALALTVLTPTVHATVLVVRSLAALVNDADHVVVVTGLGESSRWDGHGRIVSDMRVRVIDVVKGDLKRGDEVSVVRLGGAIGDLAMTVAGEATLAPSERAVVLLEDIDGRGSLRISDMSLGKFPLVLRQGVETVLPSGSGLSLVAADATGSLAPSVGPLSSATPLAEFLLVLRELAGAH